MRGTRTFADFTTLADHAVVIEQALAKITRDMAQAMDQNLFREWQKYARVPLGTRARQQWDEYPIWFQSFIKRTWWDKEQDIPNE